MLASWPLAPFSAPNLRNFCSHFLKPRVTSWVTISMVWSVPPLSSNVGISARECILLSSAILSLSFPISVATSSLTSTQAGGSACPTEPLRRQALTIRSVRERVLPPKKSPSSETDCNQPWMNQQTYKQAKLNWRVTKRPTCSHRHPLC